MVDKSEVMVSVIVLTYNHSKYIRKALDSILMQMVNFRYEILVGDDCSSDGTPNILMEYAEKRPDTFVLFLRDENVGATRNLYDLLTNAKGKYLAICEGDDYWIDERKLQIQVDFLERHLNYIGCTHSFEIINDNEKKILPQKRLFWVKNKRVFRLKDFKGIFLPGQLSTFLLRNIFLSPIYDYSYLYKIHPLIGDRTLVLFFLIQGDFYRIGRKMSRYRHNFHKRAHNVTSICYLNNPNVINQELSLVLALENCAYENFGHKLTFNQRKMEVFLDSIINYVKVPTRKNFNLIRKVLRHQRAVWLSYIFIPLGLFKKILRRLIIY